MDFPSQGAVHDQVKCSKLSMEERREIVYDLANWSHGAAETLQSWSRQEILQILCAEMGKERKYTGLTKLKIIEHLLKVVSENKLGNQNGGKVVSEKNSEDQNGGKLEQHSAPSIVQKASKRPRKPDNPSRIPVSTEASLVKEEVDLSAVTFCKNSACKAKLSKEDVFCKRCSCCICHKYDDNKDPSLWLTCSSEPPYVGDSCSMSCHLECAIKHERSGIARNGLVSQLDGCFYCVSCGKTNDLMRYWRRQLIISKDTRRVDILCYRVYLSQKLLTGTNKYRELFEIVDNAVKRLEAEVGILTGGPVKMGRGIVNRLSSGQEIQRLLASAVSSYDSMFCCTQLRQDTENKSPSMIRVEDISATSATVMLGLDSAKSEHNVGYTMWHRKAGDSIEATEPTATLKPPRTSVTVSGLSPATEYVFKVTSFDGTQELCSSEVRAITSGCPDVNDEGEKCSTLDRSQSPATNCSSLSNPSSVEDETNNIIPCNESYFDYYKSDHKMGEPNSNPNNEPLNSCNVSQDQNPSCTSEEENADDRIRTMGQSDAFRLKLKHVPDASQKIGSPSQPCVGIETNLPITPCRLESSKDVTTKKGALKNRKRNQEDKSSAKGEEVNPKSSSKKRSLEKQDEECVGDGPSNGNLEYCIKVIRCLECEGHIDKSFRQKFLTWYSIRATPQEIRIVKAFVDALIDDSASLSEQLQDTFGEMISGKSSPVVPPGFCLKLWH